MLIVLVRVLARLKPPSRRSTDLEKHVEMNWRIVHDIEQSPLLFPVLPVLLPLENCLSLLAGVGTTTGTKKDRYWMEEGDSWSGRVEGLQAHDSLAWGAGVLVGAAYFQDSWAHCGVYLLLAFLVMRFKHRVRW